MLPRRVARGAVALVAVSHRRKRPQVLVHEALEVVHEVLAHAPAEGLAEHADGAKGVRDGREEGRADGRGHRRGHLFLLRGARGDGAHALERGGEVRLRGDPDADRAVRAVRAGAVAQADALHPGRERARARAGQRAEDAPEAVAQAQIHAPAAQRARIRLTRAEHGEELAKEPLVLRLMHAKTRLPRGRVLERHRGAHRDRDCGEGARRDETREGDWGVRVKGPRGADVRVDCAEFCCH